MINEHNRKIFIAGHNGMVGSSIFRKLLSLGFEKKNIIVRHRSELDLTNQFDVFNFFKTNKISEVYLAAAKVGGIYANNTYPSEFLYENLMIELNVINSAFNTGVKKLLFLGSSCIYPKNAIQPMNEEALLSGYLEETNEAYAIAKISGIKLCEYYTRQYGKTQNIDFRSVMPTNLYGPGDNYHPQNSHVIPGLLSKFHKAKTLKSKYVDVWGSGLPKREFLHVDDLADACVMIMQLKKDIYQKNMINKVSHINIGTGKDISIKELSELISKVVGYDGEIKFDKSMPDGVSKKLLDNTIVNKIGWIPKVELFEGLIRTYDDFKKTLE